MSRAVAGAPVPKAQDGLCASVYDRLKGEILASRLRPGVKLTHQGIAEMLSVSRTPVREALERLHQEGLVVREPRRGYFVGEIGSNEVIDLYGTREALETFALARVFEKGVSGADVARLTSINRRYQKLILRDLTYERLMVDREFHLELARLAGNAFLVRSLDAIFERVILKRHVEGVTDTRGTAPYQEHVELLSALSARDASEAQAILRRHIRSACERLLTHLQRFGRIDMRAPRRRRPPASRTG